MLHTEKLKNNQLNLDNYLWKKRLLLIKNNQKNIKQLKRQLDLEEEKIKSWKIEVIFFDDQYKSNIVLIGLDGLIKLEEDKLNLEKIFKLISSMPMANF